MNRWQRMAVPSLALALVLAACSAGNGASPTTAGGGGSPAATGSGGGAGQIGGEVTVIGTWGGDEQKAFLTMVAPWEDADGRQREVHGHPRHQHRADDRRRLGRAARPGRPARPRPDGRSTPKRASSSPLDDVLDLPTYKHRDRAGAGRPRHRRRQARRRLHQGRRQGPDLVQPEAPRLQQPRRPRPGTTCRPGHGQPGRRPRRRGAWASSRGAASGWPATDWIEDLVLRQAGPDVYSSGTQGKVKWTDPAIKKAFQIYVSDVVANSVRRRETVVATNFGNAGDPLFTSPPGCEFLHQASFITGLGEFKAHKAGTDYNFFPFPDIDPQYAGAVEGAGDLFGMFHDTAAGQVADEVPGHRRRPRTSGSRSAARCRRTRTRPSYPDDISKRSAELLTNAKIFVFDASDLHADGDERRVLEGAWSTYTKAPRQLDSILADLDKVQTDAYTPVARMTDGGERPPRRTRRPSTCSGGSAMDPRLVTAVDRGGRRAGRPGRLHLGHRAGCVTLLPERLAGRASGRGCGSRRRSRFLGFFLVYPTDRDDHPQPLQQERARHHVRRPGQLRVVLHQRRRARRAENNVLWLVLLTAVHGRARAAHRGPGRPGPLRVRGEDASSSCRWRSAWSRPASSGSSCTTTSRRASPDRHAQRASAAGRASGRVAWLQSTVAAAEHLRPDRRHGLDVDRLRHGHHLGRAQGHRPRAARGGAGRRRQRVAGLPRASSFPLLVPDHRGRLDHDDHHRAEGLRHRLHA